MTGTCFTAPDFSLEGKLALITGSTQGLGLAIAQAYAACGAQVIINGRTQQRVDDVVAQFEKLGHAAYPYVQDIGQLEQLESSYVRLTANIGTPHILVNNVGVRIRQPLAQSSLADILALIQIDLLAAIQLSRLSASAMSGQSIQGRIITLTSIAGELARAGDAIYPIAKQGLAGLVRALAVEFGPVGITSNGIAPGTFATETNAAMARHPIEGPKIVGRNPMARWAQPDEISGAAVFLASHSASYVNGHILVVDGGYSITF
jgi:gluconate 5-dehydrogenase